MAYESKTKVTEINATSRVAIKIRDNYYTVEYSEKRTLPDVDDVNIEAERELLWNDVNATVDNQANEILKTFK